MLYEWHRESLDEANGKWDDDDDRVGSGNDSGGVV